MIEAILQLFISEQKAVAILSNPMIELIFIVLFTTFIVTFLFHISLFFKLKKIRNYINDTNRMDIEPLRSFKEIFDQKQKSESVKVETFVQKQFSSWRIYNIPVVNLIKIIQMTVSVFILIGILGTFIGLTMSLGSIDSGGNQLVEDVASVLSGIDIAFYTSIAGMGCSLIMTMLIKIANTEYIFTDIMLKVESNLAENEHNSFGRLIHVSETINNSIQQLQETNQHALQSLVEHFSGFKDYTTGLQQSAEDLAKFNEGLATNLQDFQKLFTDMTKVTNGFGDSTKKLNKNFDQLFSYFKRTDSRNERMLMTFENAYKNIEDASTAQIDTLKHFEDTATDLKTFTSAIVQGQRTVSDAFEKSNRESHNLVDQMKEQNKEFKQVFGNDLSTKLIGITTYLSQLSTHFDKLEDAFVHLPGALETINSTQAEYKILLSDRFNELKQFNKDFNNHLKAHSTEAATFEKRMLEATKTYEQVGIQNKQLINTINTTISQMNSAFNQRDNQIEANVDILKDTLTKYVANLEGTIGEKLDKVARNYNDYMEITNQGMKKEFKEIKNINEEVLQNSSRQIQKTFNELLQEIQKLNQQLSTYSNSVIQANNSAGMSQND